MLSPQSSMKSSWMIALVALLPSLVFGQSTTIRPSTTVAPLPSTSVVPPPVTSTVSSRTFITPITFTSSSPLTTSSALPTTSSIVTTSNGVVTTTFVTFTPSPIAPTSSETSLPSETNAPTNNSNSSVSAATTPIIVVVSVIAGAILIAVLSIYIFRKFGLKQSAAFKRRLDPSYRRSFLSPFSGGGGNANGGEYPLKEVSAANNSNSAPRQYATYEVTETTKTTVPEFNTASSVPVTSSMMAVPMTYAMAGNIETLSDMNSTVDTSSVAAMMPAGDYIYDPVLGGYIPANGAPMTTMPMTDAYYAPSQGYQSTVGSDVGYYAAPVVTNAVPAGMNPAHPNSYDYTQQQPHETSYARY